MWSNVFRGMSEVQVAKQLRMLPWGHDANIAHWLRSCLVDLNDDCNFLMLSRHAALLSALAKYQPMAVISCIDELLEEIQVRLRAMCDA